MSDPTRVWLVDDDRELLELLQRRIEACGWQWRSFEAGEALEQALHEETPHVLVLDRLLPRRSGTHLLQRLRQQGYRFPVLILSALGTADARIEGLEIGADDYMAKPFRWRELQLRLERLLEQRLSPSTPLSDPSVFELGSIRFTPAQLELEAPDGTRQSLSRGDACLLHTLCRSPGRVIARQELLQASGSLVDAASSRSIDVRISKLRTLLNACMPGGSAMIESVRGRGYRFNTSLPATAAPPP